MRKKSRKHARNGAGKLITGILVGGVVGATVGWLTAPTSGAETRRRLRLRSEAMSPRAARERAKTAARNVESQARELAETIKNSRENPTVRE